MDRLEELFDLVLDGKLGDSDAAELEHMLRDPDSGRRWARQVTLQGHLQEGCRELAYNPDAIVAEGPAQTAPAPSRKRIPLLFPLAGSLLAASLMLAVMLVQGRFGHDDSLGHIVGETGGEARAILVDSPVSGPCRVRLSDGSTLHVRSASTIRLEDSERGLRIHLDDGSLLVEAAPQKPGKQLTVLSPQACARVLGTRFELRCGNGETRLYVEEGKVAFAREGEEIVVAAGGSAYARDGEGIPVIAQSAASWTVDLRDGDITARLQEMGWSGSWVGDGLQAQRREGKPYVEVNSPEMQGGVATIEEGMDLHLHCSTDHQTWVTVVLILGDTKNTWLMNIKALQRIAPGKNQHIIIPWSAWESHGAELSQALGTRIKKVHIGAAGSDENGQLDFRLHQLSVHPPP